jgi:hypothetical protein
MGRSKNGSVELWSNGIMEKPEKRSQKCFLLLYQYSDTPLLQFFNTPVLQITEGVTHD